MSSSGFRDVGGGNLCLTLISNYVEVWWLCWPGKMVKFTFMLLKPRQQFQRCEWGHCRLGKLCRCSEITSGSRDARVDFRPLFLFADVVFPWFVYADITFSTLNNVAVFVTDAPSKRAPTVCPPSKPDSSHIFRCFHTDCHSSQSLMH
jgi:hypothetical protein